MSTTMSIILDTRRVKNNGKFPLKLRVIHQRNPKDYPTVFELTQSEYGKLSGVRINAELQLIREKISEIAFSAKSTIKELKPFDFSKFRKEYIESHPDLFKTKKTKPVVEQRLEINEEFDFSPYKKRFKIFDEDHRMPDAISLSFLVYIKKLLEHGKVGSAINYQRSYRSIKAFKGNITFSQVTVSFLHQYQTWMLNKGNSKTTVGIVLRPLRSVFNQAIEDGIIKRQDCYPFGRKKYQIPTSY